MAISTLFEPQNARYTLPALFFIGYGLYHYWRYRQLHPKIVIEDLPEPAPEIVAPTDLIIEHATIAETERKEESQVKPAPKPVRLRNRPARGRSRASAPTAYSGRELQNLLKKARWGRPENYVRLGEFAWARGALVETHFWLSLAKLNGVAGLDEWLGEIRRRWNMAGRPSEQDNVYDIYNPDHNQVAFAYISLKSGFSTSVNKTVIAEVATMGDPLIAVIANSVLR